MERWERQRAAPFSNWNRSWKKYSCGCSNCAPSQEGPLYQRRKPSETPLQPTKHITTYERRVSMATNVQSPNQSKEIKKPAPLPKPNVDFYELVETLPAQDLAVAKQVRAFMETKVAPIITKYWVDDAFPFELLPAFKELNIGGVAMQGYGCRGGSALLFGLIAMEMARFDASIATFFGVHNVLSMGSLYLGGSA